jgi:hypothetical protein
MNGECRRFPDSVADRVELRVRQRRAGAQHPRGRERLTLRLLTSVRTGSLPAMPRIKVTGYLHTEDLDDDQVDLSHATGLTEEAFAAYATGERALFLDGDSSFELEKP